MSVFKDIRDLTDDMIETDSERDQGLFEEIDKAWRSEDELPDSIKDLEWIRQVKSTDAHDELLAATRMFANKKEIVTFNPYDDSVDAHSVANKIEKALRWNMHQCNRRRKLSVRWDFVLSSLKYNAIAAQLDYLPYRRKIKGIKTPRQEALESFGDFNAIVHHPQYVHAQFSDGLLERVCTNRTVSTQSLEDFWGDRVSFDDETEVTVYDFTGYVDGELRRAVWTGSNPTDPGHVIINPDKKEGKLDLPFIPWVICFGTSTMESDPRHQYNPLLYSVINSDLLKTQNIVKTLVLSESIAHAAAPRYKISGPGAENVTVDYGDPSGALRRSPLMDETLLKFAALFQSEMDKGTVSGLLQGSQGLGGNAAFSTWNLVLQHNLAAILQYKEQAEFGLAELYTMMLLWCHSQGRPLWGYGTTKKDRGKKYEIQPQDYDPKKLHIEVELIPDMPTNRGQQVNTAVMLHREFNISEERLMEELGYGDPEELQKKRYMERKVDILRQADERRVLGQVDMDLQMQAQAAMTQGQQTQQLPLPGGGPGFGSQLGGEGMNPAEGGTPPQAFFPEGTREEQMGTTRGEMAIEEQ